MGIYELSGAGSVKTGRTLYTSMNAGNQYGAMVPIFSYVATSNANISFTNVPQTFQDLCVVVSTRDAATAGNNVLIFLLNGDGASNYSMTRLVGDGSSATSDRVSNSTFGGWTFVPNSSVSSSIFGSSICHILNYTNTTTFKTMLTRGASDTNGAGFSSMAVSMWRNTAAVNGVLVATSNGGMVTGSTVTLAFNF